MAVDFWALGYAAHPSNRGYPTQDSHTAKNEADYIAGWNAAKIEKRNERATGAIPDGKFTDLSYYC